MAQLSERIAETLGLHYVMPWPNRELQTGRPLRCSPVYERLKAKGACFGSKMGWERPLWFAGEGQSPELNYGWGKPDWLSNAAAEHEAARSGVALFDQSSFSKLLVKGPDAGAALQRICANDIDVAVGRCVYTGLLNARGGYESDLTITRLADNLFMLVTGSAQTTRDQDWIWKNLHPGEQVTITNATDSLAVFSVMGPKSRELLSKVTKADLGNEAFPFATSREIELGPGTVRATRLTYVGELGWELYVPVEIAAELYEDLVAAGEAHSLTHAGYYALESLRVEKGYRAWGHELSPEYTPLEAGLAFAVAFNKPEEFTGKAALLEQKENGITRRLVQFVLEDPDAMLWGGELVLRNGEPVGDIKSAAYGHTLGAATGLGYVNKSGGIDKAFIESGDYEIDIAGEVVGAKACLRTPYDPKALRVRS